MTEPMGEVPATSFLDALGPRADARAEPRASIALAGAGCVLAMVGVLIVSGDTGTSHGDLNRLPGLVLCALVVAGGFFALSAVRKGAVATAGTVAVALGVPPFMFFLTWDSGGLPPYSTEGILVASTAVWLAAYCVGPGRGRPFFLGAGLIGVWFTILQLSENLFDAPYVLIGGFASSFSGFQSTSTLDGSYDPSRGGYTGAVGGSGFGGPRPHLPDPTTIGAICIGLGVIYLLACRWLDQGGHHGIATPFAFATLPTLLVGVAFVSHDLEQAGTGLLLAAIGVVLAQHGSRVGRRITTWAGGAAVALGVATFLSDMTDDATIGGMLFLAGGIALVALGQVLAVALNEPDEMVIPGELASVTATSEPQPSGGDDPNLWAPPPADPPPPA